MSSPVLKPPASLSAPHPSRRRARLRALTAAALTGCVVFAAVLVLPGLGKRPLYSAGEVRNALIAQAMVESGDWLQPRLNEARYDEKPPLFYWAIATAYELIGADEFATRLPAALAFVLTVALVFCIGRELLGLHGAILAALIFTTAAAPYHFGRFVSVDTFTIAALTLSMLGLTIVTRPDRANGFPTTRTSELGGAMAFWIGAAAAGLSKGLLGLVFPVATAGLYGLLIGALMPSLRRLRLGLGALVLAVVWLPWHVALAWRDPAFLPFYILNEHVYRFLNIREPIDYATLSVPGFWLAALLWFFPWALFVPGAVPLAWRRRRTLAVPLLWSAWVVGFFTASQARLEYYAQPAYPCLAVLVAAYWLHCARRRRWLGLVLPSALLLVGGAALGAWLWLHPNASANINGLVTTADGYYREYFLKRPDRAFFFAHQALQLGKPFSVCMVLIGAGALLCLRLRRPWLAFACWVVFLTPSLSVYDRGIMLLVDDRAQKAEAEMITARWQPDAALVVVGTYEDAAGVTFYTHQRTYMLDGADGDMLFGYRRGDAADLFLSPQRFNALWHSPRRVFVLAQVEKVPVSDGQVLLETPRHRLLMNH
jgi:4-amino-4-deoxy-L-arabinose transferase-like glycosyltransferase